MKRGIGFFILAVLILLFSISCDFKNEDNNSEENNSNEEIMNDGNQEEDENEDLNNDIGKVNLDDKYEKVSEEEKRQIFNLIEEDCIFGYVTTCHQNLNFSYAINRAKYNAEFDNKVTFYLTEFSSSNIYYVGVYYKKGTMLIYDNNIDLNDIDCIYITDLNDIPASYNNKNFSFVLDVRGFVVKQDVLTGEEINYSTKVYLPLIINTGLSLKDSYGEAYDKFLPRYVEPKYPYLLMNVFDWDGEYVITSYRKTFNIQENSTCNEMFFGLLLFNIVQGVNVYESGNIKYIQLVKLGNNVSVSLEKQFELNGILKGYECDSFVDEFMKAVCAEEEVCNFENYERYIYIKYDDFLNILFKTINS